MFLGKFSTFPTCTYHYDGFYRYGNDSTILNSGEFTMPIFSSGYNVRLHNADDPHLNINDYVYSDYYHYNTVANNNISRFYMEQVLFDRDAILQYKSPYDLTIKCNIVDIKNGDYFKINFNDASGDYIQFSNISHTVSTGTFSSQYNYIIKASGLYSLYLNNNKVSSFYFCLHDDTSSLSYLSSDPEYTFDSSILYDFDFLEENINNDRKYAASIVLALYNQATISGIQNNYISYGNPIGLVYYQQYLLPYIDTYKTSNKNGTGIYRLIFGTESNNRQKLKNVHLFINNVSCLNDIGCLNCLGSHNDRIFDFLGQTDAWTKDLGRIFNTYLPCNNIDINPTGCGNTGGLFVGSSGEPVQTRAGFIQNNMVCGDYPRTLSLDVTHSSGAFPEIAGNYELSFLNNSFYGVPYYLLQYSSPVFSFNSGSQSGYFGSSLATIAYDFKTGASCLSANLHSNTPSSIFGYFDMQRIVDASDFCGGTSITGYFPISSGLFSFELRK